VEGSCGIPERAEGQGAVVSKERGVLKKKSADASSAVSFNEGRDKLVKEV